MDRKYTCCLCGKDFIGWGNNPAPLNNDANARCCDRCNEKKVIPARLNLWIAKEESIAKEVVEE